MNAPMHLKGHTTHARRGGPRHAFRHGVDYVLIDPDSRTGPTLFSRNRMNLASVSDRDHGGARGNGQGARWAWQTFAAHGLERGRQSALRLLTQPRFLSFAFNPVSFWLRYEGDAMVGVIAEVNNTFGDRHCYLCARPGFAPITARDRLTATKIFHVSPFFDVSGTYEFCFDITAEKAAIRIVLDHGNGGLIATLGGDLRPLTNRSLMGAAFRRPLGPIRTVALIHWQALRLHLKGARFHPRPIPPTEEVSR